MIDTRFETTIDLRGEIENYRQVALIKYYKILLELDPPSGQADHARRHSLYRQARKTFPRTKTTPKRQEENAGRRNSRLALPETQPTLPKSRTIRHRVHSVPRRPRRNLRHTRGTEERERFEACRREALRRKTETHGAEEKESVQPATAHEADKDLQEDYTTAGSEIPAHTPAALIAPIREHLVRHSRR